MKKSLIIKIALGALALALGTASIAKADEGVYVSGGLGMNWASKNSAKGLAAGEKLDAKWNTGPSFHLAGGYQMDEWRSELELGFYHNNLNTLSHENGDVKPLAGEQRTWTLMGNLFYDMPVLDDLDVYVGGGLGMASVKFRADRYINTAHDEWLAGRDTVFAYQLMTGVSYKITEKTALTLGYRMFTHTNTKHKARDSQGLKTHKVKASYNHSIEAGIRYLF